MPTPVVFALGVLLALPTAPEPPGRREAIFPLSTTPRAAGHTVWTGADVEALLPDTSWRTASPDTTRPALVPDTTAVPTTDDKPTRKTTLLTVLAIAVLTISTLLLYNVRSR